MNQILTGLSNHPSQLLARRQIESRINIPRLFAAIDADYNVVTPRRFTTLSCGRTRAVWIVVAQLVISLLVVLFTYPYRSHLFSYTTGILLPLLGLLMLSSLQG